MSDKLIIDGSVYDTDSDDSVNKILDEKDLVAGDGIDVTKGTNNKLTVSSNIGINYINGIPHMRYLYNDINEKALAFMSDTPFTISNTRENGLSITGIMEYKIGNGAWKTWNGKTLSSEIGDYQKHTVMFRGTGNTYLTNSVFSPLNFAITGSNVEVYGSCNYLLDYTREITQLPRISNSNCRTFFELFKNCTAITSISPNLLPATDLSLTFKNCYDSMFKGCTGLTSLPSGLLPATTLVSGCYQGMFDGCTGLTSLPSGLLPATTLQGGCYFSMFAECRSLRTLPENLLPATSLPTYCYHGMFSNCYSLQLSNTQSEIYNKLVVKIPSIVGDWSTRYMFSGISGITFNNGDSIYSK